MAWQNPKTDWAVNPKNPVPEDFNRIEGNIDFLKDDIEAKKGVIVGAITDMNQPAEITDSHAQLADKIRDISNDATAVVGDVESGKTFYSGGSKKTGTLALNGTAGTGDVLSGKTFYNTALKTKRTGTMPNRGQVIITPSTSNQAITAGYHNGSGYVKGDANLVAANIVKGKTIFGIAGTHEFMLTPGDDNIIYKQKQSVTTGDVTGEITDFADIGYSGTVKVSFGLSCSFSAYGTVYGRITKNGQQVGTLRTVTGSSFASQTFVENITVSVGDRLGIWIRAAVQNYEASATNYTISITQPPFITWSRYN